MVEVVGDDLAELSGGAGVEVVGDGAFECEGRCRRFRGVAVGRDAAGKLTLDKLLESLVEADVPGTHYF